ncbi:MAG: hypothetical protein RL660_2357 [Bacteroidota bacterium]|jgi:membrane associated rhomboid family serine protease
MEDIRYEISKSDVLKVFVMSSLYMGVLMMAKVYWQMNGENLAWFHSKVYPWLVVSKHSLTRPWTILTHAITEADVWIFISNFIWLYFFGFVIEDLKGRYSVITLMLVTALVTGIVAAVCAQVAPKLFAYEYYYGMRACVLAVVSATVFFNPTYRVFHFIQGGIPIWTVGVLYLFLSMFAGTGDGINIVCMLIAVLLGYLYNKQLSGMFDALRARLLNMNAVGTSKPKPKQQAPISKPVMKVVSIEQERVDRLLDKINKDGINSLTPEERAWLEAYSQK